MAKIYNPQNFKPAWGETKKSQIINFVAGEDIPAKAFVTRLATDPHIAIVWDCSPGSKATGYNCMNKTIKAGCRFDVVVDGYDIECETGSVVGGTVTDGDTPGIWFKEDKVVIPAGETRVVSSINASLGKCSEYLLCYEDTVNGNTSTLKVVGNWDDSTTDIQCYACMGEVLNCTTENLTATHFEILVENKGPNPICVNTSRIFL